MRKGLVRLFFAALLLLAGSPMKAAPVSVDSARTVAAHVLGKDTSQLENRTSELYSSFQAFMYLFVPESGVGFALVSADDRALPVLGYSTTSVFNPTYTDYGTSYTIYHWLYVYMNQINAMRNGNTAASSEVAAQWEQWMSGVPVASGTAVGPLLTTTWDQADDYQQLTPLASASVHCKAGPAALAMAQVMKYWNHPERGVGSVSYPNGTSPYVQVSANFDTAYLWSDMPDALDGSSTEAQRAAVSLLVYHAGAAAQTRFSTGTYNYNSSYTNISNALKNNFRYRPSTIRSVYLNSSTAANWNTLIMDDLTQSRPVIYLVQSKYAFAVDGCDAGGRFHVNWGRGGLNDGYYVVGSLNPGAYTYTSRSQYVILGIEPNTTYAVSAGSNNEAWGSVSGGGTYWGDDSVVLTATPFVGSRFRHWDDGGTDNPRRFLATEDRADTAIFEFVGIADIQVASNNGSWGSVGGGGVFTVGDRVLLRATASLGYRFDRWNDGNTENPRRFLASESRNDTAIFVHVGTATIHAVADNTELGSASGGGTFTVGDKVVLTAKPVSGWIFERWDDGSTDNPRRFLATEDRTYTAYFVRPGVGDPQFHLVELDDRESHSWSYYSDSTCLVRSLNPADVRIRYFGYGENTMYSSNALEPEGDPDTDVSPYMVGIGIDAPWKNTYVYHKTLERVNGEDAASMAAADGPCFYRLIPNPYSRRPTHGEGDTRWRGFYKWRLKTLTGGSIYKDTAMTHPLAVGAMLDAEDTVFFMPEAEYSMEVDFEAIWARAVVYPTLFSFDTSADGQYVTGKNAYERNFVVHTCNDCLWDRDNLGAEKDFTMTSIHPDGTDGESNILHTEVPSFGNLSGNYEIYRLQQLNQSRFWGSGWSDCSGSYVPQNARVGSLVIPSSGSLATGSGSMNTSEPFFFPWETIKFEYIKLSFGLQRETYIYFCPSSCAVQENDSTYYVVVNPSQPGTDNSGGLMRGDTVWLKEYNYDTLYSISPKKVSGSAMSYSNAQHTRGGSMICGRMCLPEDGYKFFLQGYGEYYGTTATELSDTRDKNVRFRLESGTFANMFWFLSPNTNSTMTTNGRVCLDVVIGNDYDRSRGDNSKLLIPRSHGANTIVVKDSVNKNSRMYNYVIKSGTFTARYNGNPADQWNPLIYLGDRAAKGYIGARVLTVEGGDIDCIGAGMDSSDDTVEYVDKNYMQVRIYIKGGRVENAVYGAATRAFAKGSRRMVFTGGEVNGWIAGGCNGSDTSNGQLIGNSFIYFGGRAKLQHDARDKTFFYSKGGNLFGAGSGHSSATGPGANVGKVENTYIVVGDSAYISRDVYGGGNFGHCGGDSSNIQILGGTVAGKVFGGSNRQRGFKVNVEMRDGLVVGGVYGGSNTIGNVKGPIKVHIKGGTVGNPGCAVDSGNVFGCGYGEQTSVTGDVHVIIGHEDAKYPHADTPLIHGDVYGGGFGGTYNSSEHPLKVTTHNGRIKRSVFGGGFGKTAVTTGNTEVKVLGTTHVESNVYGGGNMGKVTGNTKVVIGD